MIGQGFHPMIYQILQVTKRSIYSMFKITIKIFLPEERNITNSKKKKKGLYKLVLDLSFNWL